MSPDSCIHLKYFYAIFWILSVQTEMNLIAKSDYIHLPAWQPPVGC